MHQMFRWYFIWIAASESFWMQIVTEWLVSCYGRKCERAKSNSNANNVKRVTGSDENERVKKEEMKSVLIVHYDGCYIYGVAFLWETMFFGCQFGWCGSHEDDGNVPKMITMHEKRFGCRIFTVLCD